MDPQKKQPTIDGLPPPTPPPLGKKGTNKRYQDVDLKLAKLQKEQQHRPRSKGPRTPAQELAWQEISRIDPPVGHQGEGSLAPGFTPAEDDLKSSNKQEMYQT